MQVVVKETFYDVPKYAMSAEVENGKDEEADGKQQKKPLHKKLLEHWQIGFKLIELIFCCICMAFIYEPVKNTGLGKTHLHHVGVMYTAYTGYMLVIVTILLGRLLQDRLPFKTSAMFSVVGCCLFTVTGILLLSDKTNLTKRSIFHPHMYLMAMLTTSAFFALINACVFLIDAVLTFRRRQDL